MTYVEPSEVRASSNDIRRQTRPGLVADTRNVPVVVASGTDTSDLDPKDFAAILKKPIGPDTLVKVIDDAVCGTTRPVVEPA